MALSHVKIISKKLTARVPSLYHLSKKEFAEDASNTTNTGPYRPSPLDSYFYPRAAKYWLKQYPAQPSNKDEYEKEEIYLHELEERMKKYDKSWNMSDRTKSLYNEFGWQNEDDRANYIYGNNNNEEELKYGPGNKIDPNHYINPDFVVTSRKSIAPIQYLNNDQIRNFRGYLSNYRMMIPEQPSLFKFWNGYSALAVFTSILVTKELYVVGLHDMIDALLTWSFFGICFSIGADWLSWANTLSIQENYDKEFFPLQYKIEYLNQIIEILNNKPNQQQLLSSLLIYRNLLAEKVLQKTLNNRVNTILDNTLSKLQEKLNEENNYKKQIENEWEQETKKKIKFFF